MQGSFDYYICIWNKYVQLIEALLIKARSVLIITTNYYNRFGEVTGNINVCKILPIVMVYNKNKLQSTYFEKIGSVSHSFKTRQSKVCRHLKKVKQTICKQFTELLPKNIWSTPKAVHYYKIIISLVKSKANHYSGPCALIPPLRGHVFHRHFGELFS
jgi:hypothetical protein